MAEDNTPFRTVWVACQRTACKNALSTVLPVELGANTPAAPQHRKFQAEREASVRRKVCLVCGMHKWPDLGERERKEKKSTENVQETKGNDGKGKARNA